MRRRVQAAAFYLAALLFLTPFALRWAEAAEKEEKPGASPPGKEAKPPSANKLISQAREALAQSRLQPAADLFGQYLQYYPDGPDRDEAAFSYAQALFLLFDLDGAEAALMREEGRNQKYADRILYYRAEIASARRDYSGALSLFLQLPQKYPSSPLAPQATLRQADLFFLAGNQFYEQGSYTAAIEHYFKVKAGRPELAPLVRYHVGMSYLRLGETEKAAEVLGELKAGGEGEAARLAWYRLARLSEDSGKLAEAEAAFKDLAESSPGHYLESLARDGLARVWFRQGRSAEATNYWKERQPDTSAARLSRSFDQALMHYLHREYTSAAEILQSLLSTSTDPELQWKAKVWLARVHATAGRKADALRVWKEFFQTPEQVQDFMRVEYALLLLETNPQEAALVIGPMHAPEGDDAWGVRARLRLLTSDVEAETAADEYLSRYPQGRHTGEVALLRGRLRQSKGNLRGAESDFRLALEQHRNPEKRLEAAQELAHLYSLQGNAAAAEQILSQALANAPQSLTAEGKLLRQNAAIAYEQKDFQKGVEIYQKLCTAGKEKFACSPEDLFGLFFGYYRLQKYDQADQVLTHLAAAGGEHLFTAAFWRGMMLYHQKNPAAAFAVLRDLNPPGPMELGFLAWLISQVQIQGGAAQEAANTLARMESMAPQFAYYAKGRLMETALPGGALDKYLRDLPAAEKLDEEKLSQTALLSVLRTKARAKAPASELLAINDLLQVEGTSLDVLAEGILIVSRSTLGSAPPAERVSPLGEIFSRLPSPLVETELRLARAELAYAHQDYLTARLLLKPLDPEETADELRFPLLYLQGMTAKQLGRYEDIRLPFLSLVREYQNTEVLADQWCDIGIGLFLAREFTSASTALELALAKAQDRALLAEIYYWKGMADYGSGNLSSALANFLKVVNEFKDQDLWAVTAQYEAANVYAEMGEVDKALELYRKVQLASGGDRARLEKINEKIRELQKIKREKPPGGERRDTKAPSPSSTPPR